MCLGGVLEVNKEGRTKSFRPSLANFVLREGKPLYTRRVYVLPSWLNLGESFSLNLFLSSLPSISHITN